MDLYQNCSWCCEVIWYICIYLGCADFILDHEVHGAKCLILKIVIMIIIIIIKQKNGKALYLVASDQVGSNLQKLIL